jgi:hypothetical protein
MAATNTNHTKNAERIRRKKLLRAFREDQQTIIWIKVLDEVGPCDIADSDRDCYSFDFLDPATDSEFEDPDEDYPNKAETLRNIFECD